MARIGLLTGGGDCPGLNAAIRAVVRRGVDLHGHTILGFQDGWRGVMEGSAEELTRAGVRGILHRGGTILGTSSASPLYAEGGVDRVRETLKVHELDGFIAIGGEGTLKAAARMPDVPVIGIPKTIDNDLSGTDYTIGFHTALQVATDAIDRVHTTAESHDRVIVVEVMGRNAGWIALYAGVAGGADVILLPERPFNIADVCLGLRRRHLEVGSFSIVVVAEGAVPIEGTLNLPDYPTDEYGWPRLGGISAIVAAEIWERTGFDTRVVILGHVQRGGAPSAYDRMLATRLATAAIDLAGDGAWGTMVGVRGTKVVNVPITEGVATQNLVPEELLDSLSFLFS